jgi:hypothetical protein
MRIHAAACFISIQIMAAPSTVWGLELTDVNTSDQNRIVYQALELLAEVKLGEPSVPFDTVLSLNEADLEQRLRGLFLNIENTSGTHWSSYGFEFYDPTFTEPLRLPLNSWFVGPQETLPWPYSDWDFLPDFRADRVELTGGRGVGPRETFTVIFTFNVPQLLEAYPAPEGTYQFGIRQTVEAQPAEVPEPVPDGGATAWLLAAASLGLVVMRKSIPKS